MKKAIALVLAAIIAVIMVVAAATPVGAATVNVTATSNTKLVLSLNTGSVDFPSVDPDTGAEITGAVSAQVKSNVLWNLDVVATSDLVGSSATVPIGNLQWQDQSNPGYIPFQLTNYTIADHHGRGVTNYTFDYKINIGYDYPPDTYSTSLIYTLTQAP